MAIYKNISTDTTSDPVVLIKKGSSISGSIKKITIANHDDSSSNLINLFLTDGSNNFVIVETTIPSRVTLVLEDNLRFDSSVYDLKIATNSTATTTVIIT
tara:strand:- start:44 stop:343 length:300 start_codon:yes stop_codon:yes gene_type:complete